MRIVEDTFLFLRSAGFDIRFLMYHCRLLRLSTLPIFGFPTVVHPSQFQLPLVTLCRLNNRFVMSALVRFRFEFYQHRVPRVRVVGLFGSEGRVCLVGVCMIAFFVAGWRCQGR